ncbi:MAG: [FeFe] hydrogenase H-cluster radical SAM maturase HydG, partial [Clostridiales bacterium]|nr:[FeFe] hydrogenase H-cluster radical SAM maturase HydG [Clostridiales bacterium]
MFINHEEIYKILEETKNPSNEEIKEVLNRAKKREGLSYKDIAILLQTEDEKDLEEIYSLAGEIKRDIYGKRIVVFAPLYVSDYCVNNCVYCGYRRDNEFCRRRL